MFFVTYGRHVGGHVVGNLVKSVFSLLTESLSKTLLGTLSETTVVVKTRPMATFSLIHGRHVGASPKDSNMISPTLSRRICE